VFNFLAPAVQLPNHRSQPRRPLAPGHRRRHRAAAGRDARRRGRSLIPRQPAARHNPHHRGCSAPDVGLARPIPRHSHAPPRRTWLTARVTPILLLQTAQEPSDHG
jgi:hypothetical protein